VSPVNDEEPAASFDLQLIIKKLIQLLLPDLKAGLGASILMRRIAY
jgi:hypothetical protein